MKIIYTDYFQQEMKKYWKKEKIDEKEFFDRIIQRLVADPLYLSRPYMKLKIPYKNHALRIIIHYNESKKIIIPILITDKNNAIYGNNIRWNKIIKENTIHAMKKISKDIKERKATILDMT